MTCEAISRVLTAVLLCVPVTGVAEAEPLQGHERDGKTESASLDLAVKHTIVKATDRFQRCYLDYLKSGGAVKEGTLTVDWQITPNGKTIKTELVSSSFATAGAKPALEPCVVKQVATLEFPPTGKPENHYTFHKFRFKDVQTATPTLLK